MNDEKFTPGPWERAMIEAAHVAVTAIRTMQILNDKRSVFHG